MVCVDHEGLRLQLERLAEEIRVLEETYKHTLAASLTESARLIEETIRNLSLAVTRN